MLTNSSKHFKASTKTNSSAISKRTSKLKKCSNSTEAIKPKYHLSEIENFVWQTADGQDWRPNYMTTDRLLGYLISVFNSCVPKNIRLCDPSIGYIPKSWSPRYKRSAVIASLRELVKRELTHDQLFYIRHMQSAARKM